jgi:hypothetical protein
VELLVNFFQLLNQIVSNLQFLLLIHSWLGNETSFSISQSTFSLLDLSFIIIFVKIYIRLFCCMRGNLAELIFSFRVLLNDDLSPRVYGNLLELRRVFRMKHRVCLSFYISLICASIFSYGCLILLVSCLLSLFIDLLARKIVLAVSRVWLFFVHVFCCEAFKIYILVLSSICFLDFGE